MFRKDLPMMRPVLSACAALAATLSASAASSQAAPAGPSQDAAWHNRQMLALAERQASDGWGYLDGGVLWRRVAGDGAGPRPTADDTVMLHYVGTLVDGTEFDS